MYTMFVPESMILVPNLWFTGASSNSRISAQSLSINFDPSPNFKLKLGGPGYADCCLLGSRLWLPSGSHLKFLSDICPSVTSIALSVPIFNCWELLAEDFCGLHLILSPLVAKATALETLKTKPNRALLSKICRQDFSGGGGGGMVRKHEDSAEDTL